MGERKNRQKMAVATVSEPLVVDTMGGRIHVQWDESAQATPNGQLVFLAEFLACTGVFDRWVETCPLTYTSPNSPGNRDVLGTLLLGILAGHRRYAHITGLRGDSVAPRALGMNKVISEDSLCRALARIDEQSSQAWLRPALLSSVRDALDRDWILDIDASVKPLYGQQEGALKGYNPRKPGRPSHVLHTYWVRPLRQVLDVQLSPGNQHAGAHARAGLEQLLDALGDRTPALVRGDSGYGNEGILVALEQRQQPYLLRLRLTSNVQRLVRRQFDRLDWSRADDQGFQAVEDEVKLTGWSQMRRVVILRRRLREGIARETVNDHGQLSLDFADHHVLDASRMWEYTVLVTNATYPRQSIAQLYRERCDCENGFDELKNQWGLSGLTTRDLNRSQTTARAGALVYNWWSWYCRAAHPGGRLEAITSRPLLLAAVGKAASHARQTTLYLTSMHARTETIKQLIVNIRAALRHVRLAAEQFRDADRWGTLLRYVCQKIAPRIDAPPTPATLPATG